MIVGLVQRLETHPRLLLVLQVLVDANGLREVCAQNRVSVPGFRPAQAPLNLLARHLARQAFADPRVRRGLKRLFERLARPGRSALANQSKFEKKAEKMLTRFSSFTAL